MPRYPSIWLACQAARRSVRRHGIGSIQTRRTAELVGSVVAPPADGLTVTDHEVPVVDGTIQVRAYRPAGERPRPAHLLAHGGAFCTGSPAQIDPLARLYALRAGCLVLSVAYRLAPEHTWPTAAEDYYAALGWTAENAAELGVDVDRISVGGVSAGGGLAAVAALMSRDRSGPPVLFQLLEIPQLDLTFGEPSMTRFAKGYLVTRAELERGVTNYCPDAADRADPYASPLLADDLSKLPPALILTCQYDPLRDDGERYAERLREAGGEATVVRARGHVHSSTYSQMRSARQYRELTAAALRAAYDRSRD